MGKTKYRSQTTITERQYNGNVEYYDDEYFYRTVIQQMINEIPMEDLKKLFEVNKINPFSEKSLGILYDYRTPDYLREKIRTLQDARVIEYSVNIEI